MNGLQKIFLGYEKIYIIDTSALIGFTTYESDDYAPSGTSSFKNKTIDIDEDIIDYLIKLDDKVLKIGVAFPIKLLEELDNIKNNRSHENQDKAKLIVRWFYSNLTKKDTILSKGVEIKRRKDNKKFKIKIICLKEIIKPGEDSPPWLTSEINDDFFITLAYKLNKQLNEKEIIFLTMDILAYIRSKEAGIKSIIELK